MAVKIPPEVYSNAVAKSEWLRLADVIGINETNSAILSFYCVTYATYQEARARVDKEGITTRTPNGCTVPNPCLGIANTSLKLCIRAAKELGLGAGDAADEIELPE